MEAAPRVATDAAARPWQATPGRAPVLYGAVAGAGFVLGGLLLAGEAAVHVQQYAQLVHGVRWMGPLFLANAAASVAAIAGLVYPPTRLFAALAGVVISTLALAGLVVSYGRGLFGWREAGFRTAIGLAVTTELGAVILLTLALAATTALLQARASRP